MRRSDESVRRSGAKGRRIFVKPADQQLTVRAFVDSPSAQHRYRDRQHGAE